jgi:hypothetical protein
MDAHDCLFFSISSQGISLPGTATVFSREDSPLTRRTADFGTQPAGPQMHIRFVIDRRRSNL